MQNGRYEFRENGLDAFSGTRVRIQRLSDLRFFTGWVETLSDVTVRIRLHASALVLLEGETANIEISGAGSTANLMGTVRTCFEDLVDFNISSKVTLRDTQEPVRVSTIGLSGTLQLPSSTVDINLTDISEGGFGGIVAERIDRATIVNAEIFTPHGPVHVKGEVRYCRVDKDNPNQHRIGVALHDLCRVDRARWQLLMKRSAA